jgi:hypothetical protein
MDLRQRRVCGQRENASDLKPALIRSRHRLCRVHRKPFYLFGPEASLLLHPREWRVTGAETQQLTRLPYAPCWSSAAWSFPFCDQHRDGHRVGVPLSSPVKALPLRGKIGEIPTKLLAEYRQRS